MKTSYWNTNQTELGAGSQGMCRPQLPSCSQHFFAVWVWQRNKPQRSSWKVGIALINCSLQSSLTEHFYEYLSTFGYEPDYFHQLRSVLTGRWTKKTSICSTWLLRRDSKLRFLSFMDPNLVQAHYCLKCMHPTSLWAKIPWHFWGFCGKGKVKLELSFYSLCRIRVKHPALTSCNRPCCSTRQRASRALSLLLWIPCPAG